MRYLLDAGVGLMFGFIGSWIYYEFFASYQNSALELLREIKRDCNEWQYPKDWK